MQDYGDPKPARTLKSLTLAREQTHKTGLSGAQLAGRYTQQGLLPLGDYLLLTDPPSDMRLSVTGRERTWFCSTVLKKVLQSQQPPMPAAVRLCVMSSKNEIHGPQKEIFYRELEQKGP